jgi:DNA helicase IV
MRDIVATIQASQDAIVRSPADQLLLVQGGPGTGKTVVALHRVSWILYNHRDISPADVLVVGPNPTFGRYIRKVLPDLGDHDVVQRDLTSLGSVISTGVRDEMDVARLKGDDRLAGLLTRGLRARVRTLSEPITNSDIDLRGDDIAQAVNVGLAAMDRSNYVVGRQEARRAAFDAAVRRRPGSTPPTPALELALERIWPSLSPAQFVRELLGSRERLLEAAGAEFTAAEVTTLYRQSADKVTQEPWTDSDVALLDEAHALIHGQSETYRHIVVDEAQDLTPMQLRSLRRRSSTGAMTIVGDLAQSTGAWARDTWDDVVGALRADVPVTIEELDIGYRVPRQVMTLAEKLLPLAAPTVKAPRVIRESSEEPTLEKHDPDDLALPAVVAAQGYAARGLFVGVITTDDCRDEIIATLKRRNVVWSDGRAGGLGPTGINIVDPATAKGLEFEAVVVVGPRSITEMEHGVRLLYIALTRTTKFLTVVHDGAVLPGVDAVSAPDLPPIPVLVAQKEDQADPAVPDTHDTTQRGPRPGLETTVYAASIDELARQVCEAVPAHLRAAMLDGLRRRLEIAADDVVDFMD